jgi:hypothetical protein
MDPGPARLRLEAAGLSADWGEGPRLRPEGLAGSRDRIRGRDSTRRLDIFEVRQGKIVHEWESGPIPKP